MLVCLLSGPGIFSCFSVGVRGNIVYACVCKRSSAILCVLVEIVLGWREMQCVFIYRRRSEGEGGRES